MAMKIPQLFFVADCNEQQEGSCLCKSFVLLQKKSCPIGQL